MKKDNFIFYTFLIIIFGIFIYVPIKQVLISLHIIDFYKSDNWKLVEKSDDYIYDKIMSLEANIENRYDNYFPFYEHINGAFYNSIINIDSIYLKDIYLKDNIDMDRIFYSKENDFLYLVNRYSYEELDNRLNTQVDFYNSINNKYPDINLAIYVPLRYEFTGIQNINNTSKLIELFTSKLNNGINYKLFETNNIKEYLKYYYKSDHHYNSYGAKIAYDEIIKMYNLDNKYQEVEHKLVHEPYYGSMAKSTLLKNVADNFTVMDIPNNLKVNIKDKSFKPLNMSNHSNPFYDYYVGYFNSSFDEIIYTNNTNTNKNLLIFGDSMGWQIDYMLANSFDNTYVVNIKYGKWQDNSLNLDKYIKQHNITHILFLRVSNNTIFDTDNYHIEKKVNV
ncbi:MAG: hypothetical protein IJ574_01065 [Bacilli bacterium]|nr:hypothetical protein [Bacilli bacterium]